MAMDLRLPLFDSFSGTLGVSDFSSVWMAGFRRSAFPAPAVEVATVPDEISQLLCTRLPDMPRVCDRAGSEHVKILNNHVVEQRWSGGCWVAPPASATHALGATSGVSAKDPETIENQPADVDQGEGFVR